MTENLYAGDVGSILSEAITTDDEVFVVNPTGDALSEIVFGLHEAGDASAVNVLAEKAALKAATADFVVASHAADLRADGALSIRWTDDGASTTLLVSRQRVVSVVQVGERVAGIQATEDGFVAEAFDHYDDQWTDAEQYRLNTPPLSEVRETLATELGEGVAADFDAMLSALPAVTDDGDGLDEVTVCLLIAARHGVLLYDVSRWGETVGLASKATFSRTKGVLEDAGVIRTEKVPIDVGRPRLRLRLATDRLRAADPSALATLARERIAAADQP